MAAGAPVIRLSPVEEHVSWEDTGVSWHARWAVPTLLIRARLSKVDSRLLREVSHVVHSLNLSLGFGGSQNDGLAQHNITVVGVQLAANGTITAEAAAGSGWLVMVQTYSTLT